MENIENNNIKLKSSPLFNLSLTNKELFHSNFIAWFGREYGDYFKELMNCILDGKNNDWDKDLDTFKICREYKHFDLCVKDNLDIPRLIIENKVKSIPTKKQLQEYEQKIKKDYNDKSQNVAFVLLTMSKSLQDNDNSSNITNWNIVTYDELSIKLKKIIEENNNINDYHKLLIKDYCDYVSNLQRIIDDTANDNKFFYGKTQTQKMNELGIHDICGKRKMQSVYNILIEKIKSDNTLEIVQGDELESGTNKIKISWGYTDKPLIEARFKRNDDYVIIQIQGSQYRHAVEFFDEKIGHRIMNENKKYVPSEKGLEYLKENYSYILFGDDALNKYPKFNGKDSEFGQNKKNGEKKCGYCKYCNGRIQDNGKISCFVYQWVKIPDDISIDCLTNAIIDDLKNLITIMNQSEGGLQHRL